MRERERQSFFLRTLPSPIAKCPTFVSSLSACTLVGRTRPELCVCVCVHEARRKPRSRFFLLLPLRDGFPLAGTFASNFVTLERQRRRTPRRQAVADGRNFAARRYEQRKEGGKGRGERFNRPPSLATNPYVSQPFCSGYPSADEQYLDGNRPISSPLPNPLLSPLSPFLLPSRRVHTESEREREERSMRKAHSFPFRVSLARSTSFEARDERVVEFSTGGIVSRESFRAVIACCPAGVT